jgi:hypothetical protein
MEYTHLGRTGLTVSRIGLGALKAAAPENLPGAHALMDRALEHVPHTARHPRLWRCTRLARAQIHAATSPRAASLR